MKRIWYWRIFGAGVTLLVMLLLSLLWCDMPPARALVYAGLTAVGGLAGTFGIKRRPNEDREADREAFALFPILKWVVRIALFAGVVIFVVCFFAGFGKFNPESSTKAVAFVLMIVSNLLVYRFGLEE